MIQLMSKITFLYLIFFVEPKFFRSVFQTPIPVQTKMVAASMTKYDTPHVKYFIPIFHSFWNLYFLYLCFRHQSLFKTTMAAAPIFPPHQNDTQKIHSHIFFPFTHHGTSIFNLHLLHSRHKSLFKQQWRLLPLLPPGAWRRGQLHMPRLRRPRSEEQEPHVRAAQ